MNLLRALPVFALSLVMAATASAQDAKQSPASPHFDVTPLITGGLLDSSTSIEHRRELANRLIEAADRDKSPVLLYYVGSLYRQGDWAGIAPFPQGLRPQACARGLARKSSRADSRCLRQFHVST